MGVTRKERLLKAMLEDNADACGGGVTREERLLAQTAKKACENDVLEGGGSGGGVTWFNTPSTNKPMTALDGQPVTETMFKDAMSSGPVMLKSGDGGILVVAYMINDAYKGIVTIEMNPSSTSVLKNNTVIFAEE